MELINRYSLEEFAKRHRADFDLHEPRPELWDALEKQLDADAPRPGQPHLRVAANEPAAAEMPAADVAAAASGSVPAASVPQLRLRAQRRPVRWQPLGVVLGVLALVLTLGISRWHTAPAADATLVAGRAAMPDAALYLAQAAAEATPASQSGPDGNARLDTAVHGMERYYAVQLAERQAQLAQLAPGNQAEWGQDITSLDSIYQQLKAELPQHPQPEAVLTAMNRNLQTRLDILDQQLALRGDAQVAQSATMPGGEYALANSRSMADNLSPHAR